DRRRPPATASARPRGAGGVHPRLVGAARPVAQARSRFRQPEGLRHVRRRLDVARAPMRWLDETSLQSGVGCDARSKMPRSTPGHFLWRDVDKALLRYE